MTAALMLAAGSSNRMEGKDKCLELVENRPCIAVLAERAQRADLDLKVVVPDFFHPRAKILTGIDLVESPRASSGMASSLQAGIEALPRQTNSVVIMLADMPDITTQDLRKIVQVHKESQKGIVQAATHAGTPGHPVLFSRKYFRDLKSLTGDHGAKKVIIMHEHDRMLVPLADDRARIDLDTSKAWLEWRRTQQINKVPDKPVLTS
ncbi:MAG: nucleotidyltransferase family protein [Aestuariivita sp.]|nr:nucleotidyltransferase family protein [Aestuariivita sp.]